MASTMTAFAEQHSFSNYADAGLDPPELARHKLDRLRELRAVIDTLRRESEPRDPLLAWIVERERIDSHA